MKTKTKITALVVTLTVIAVAFFIAILVISVILPDESVADAKEDTGMRFVSMDVDIEWRKDRSCRVKQNIVAEFYTQSHGIYVDIPVNSGEKVRDLKVTAADGSGRSKPCALEHQELFKIVRIVVGDPDVIIGAGERLICRVEYDYVTPVHPDGENILDINAIGYGWTSRIDNASVSVTYPAAPINKGGIGVWVGYVKTGDVNVSADGRTYSVNNVPLDAFKGIRFKSEMASGVLTDRKDTEWLWTVPIGLIVAVAFTVLMIFVGKEKAVTPIVSFYPPFTTDKEGCKRRMLPIQVGKLIDGSCSNEDVTSLIFYWASEGFLSIEEKEDDIYFTKLKDIDSVTDYERRMFDALFKDAVQIKTKKKEVKVNNIDVFDDFPDSKVAAAEQTEEQYNPTVSLSSLKGNFATTLLYARNGVNNQYRFKLYRSAYTALAIFAAVLCAVYGVCNEIGRAHV